MIQVGKNFCVQETDPCSSPIKNTKRKKAPVSSQNWDEYFLSPSPIPLRTAEAWSKVLTLKVEYSTLKFSAKYDIFHGCQKVSEGCTKLKPKNKTQNLFVNDQKWVPSIIQKTNILKINMCMGLIFGKVESWAPIRAEGC